LRRRPCYGDSTWAHSSLLVDAQLGRPASGTVRLRGQALTVKLEYNPPSRQTRVTFTPLLYAYDPAAPASSSSFGGSIRRASTAWGGGTQGGFSSPYNGYALSQ
jgi:hypothetical protein